MERYRKSKLPLAIGAAVLMSTLSAFAEEGRYQLEKSADGFVRLDTTSGEMSVCKLQKKQLVCRTAADERAAFQDEIDALDQRIEQLERQVLALEKGRNYSRQGFPSEEEFEQTLGYMEKFLRRFMDIIEEFDRAPKDLAPGSPDRT